jgi:hypothetical protein
MSRFYDQVDNFRVGDHPTGIVPALPGSPFGAPSATSGDKGRAENFCRSAVILGQYAGRSHTK